MNPRIVRLLPAAALIAALAIPATAIAADPQPAAPPTAVVEWQAHLDHMGSMDGNLGGHVRDCVAAHGSAAGMLGPNGAMVETMAGGMMR